MKKEDVFSGVKKKLNVLEPQFKEQISKILENIGSSLSMLYDVATRDEKTGIYNHRFFKTVAEMEIAKAKRGDKLSLVIIDIDHFKKFNDTYGHLTGDEILKELANCLQKELRKYDVLARFGGEEFFALLPKTTIKTAATVAERLRQSLQKNKKLKKFKVTISLGVSEYKKSDTLEKLIKRADTALYDSKKNGRNQVTVSK
jgi:diguanylate cyclase (GGDEF)-like protein